MDLQDNLAEHINLLSFLDPGGKRTCLDSSKFDSSDTVGSLAILKERLARYIAYERKSDSSKFLEYWVPVRLSDVQLELYCATLISNLLPLRSYTKTDSVGALRDILISLRKVCLDLLFSPVTHWFSSCFTFFQMLFGLKLYGVMDLLIV